MITWFDNKLCDAGFIINLSNRKERLESAQKELELAGIKGVERFEAIKLSPNDGPEIDFPYHKYGCTQSHIEIAKKQIKNNWDYVLYLEDDISFDPFYGSNIQNNKIDSNKVVFDLISDFKLLKPDVLWLGVRLNNFAKKITNNLLEPKETLMSHAYIGSLKYANFLVDNLKWDDPNYFSSKWAIDFFISQLIVKSDWQIPVKCGGENIINNDLKIVVSIPLFFTQKGFYSDLTEKYEDYAQWVKHNYNYYASLQIDMKPCLINSTTQEHY